MEDQGTLFEILGWVASITMILGYLPQAIQTIRTRNTDGIALPTFLMMGIGSACFMLQGILHKPDTLWALFITNLITTICSSIVFGIKIYNDYFKKKS
ncbi:MAG: PQ-loop repeat-containing protein [Prevotella sp.]|nr:PQ-loop repeat-containing protein [Prevotella sp.]